MGEKEDLRDGVDGREKGTERRISMEERGGVDKSERVVERLCQNGNPIYIGTKGTSV